MSALPSGDLQQRGTALAHRGTPIMIACRFQFLALLVSATPTSVAWPSAPSPPQETTMLAIANHYRSSLSKVIRQGAFAGI
jgi:hypothetical protein